MPYQQMVGSEHPALFLFVLDRSGSMARTWPDDSDIVKAEFLADVVNKTIREIGSSSLASDGSIRPRCHLGVVAYDGQGVRSLWGGALAGRDLVSITEAMENPLGEFTKTVQLADGEGGVIPVEKRFKVWIEADATGTTPMGQAMRKARELVEGWLADPIHQHSFPPVVIHVTDGVPDAGEARLAASEAEAIQRLSTTDGNALVLSVHIPDGIALGMRMFPKTADEVQTNDGSGELLFKMSSPLPEQMRELAEQQGFMVAPDAKLMIINADAVALTKMLRFGTMPGTRAARTMGE